MGPVDKLIADWYGRVRSARGADCWPALYEQTFSDGGPDLDDALDPGLRELETRLRSIRERQRI